MQGQIIKISSNRHVVNSNGINYNTIPRGKFRKEKLIPKVGDYVVFDDKSLVIEEILPRKNTFNRPVVSNIDRAFIITSLVNPDFSLGLLDKFIAHMELNNVDVVICLTKTDLVSKEDYEKIKEIMVYYTNIGYIVLTNNDLDKIKELIKDNTVVFIGQTGAGKSTLLNKLNPDWQLKTGEVSLALGRGRHTTRNVELYDFLDGKVLDTPGFSALDLSIYKKEDIKYAFREFSNYTCPFRDCSHTKEAECSIKKAVEDGKILKSRYDSYLKFYEEASK